MVFVSSVSGLLAHAAPRALRGDQGRHEPDAPGHGARVGAVRRHGQRRRARLHRDRPDQGLPRQGQSPGRAWNRSSRPSASAGRRRWPTRSRSSPRTGPASSPARSCTSTAAGSSSERPAEHDSPTPEGHPVPSHPFPYRAASRGGRWSSPAPAPASAPRSRSAPPRRAPAPSGVHYRSSAEGAERTADRVSARGQHAGAAPGRHRRLGADQGHGRRRLRAASAASTSLVNNVGDVAREQMSWRDITEESIDHVLARGHQGHDALRARVRRADAGPGARRHREHRVHRHRPRQRPGAAVRRGEVRAARPDEVVRARVRADGPGQRLRPRVHRDRGHPGPQGLAVRAARPADAR